MEEVTEKRRLEVLESFLLGCKIALPWMVDSLKYPINETDGTYSPELEHAISLREAAEAL